MNNGLIAVILIMSGLSLFMSIVSVLLINDAMKQIDSNDLKKLHEYSDKFYYFAKADDRSYKNERIINNLIDKFNNLPQTKAKKAQELINEAKQLIGVLDE